MCIIFHSADVALSKSDVGYRESPIWSDVDLSGLLKGAFWAMNIQLKLPFRNFTQNVVIHCMGNGPTGAERNWDGV